MKGREEREGEGEYGEGGSGRGERIGKGEGELDLYICSGAPSFRLRHWLHFKTCRAT